jgi:hypothetical protein
VLAEGARQGVFRPGLDVRHVYLALAALGYFYLSNRYTLSSFLDRDLMQREARDAWLAEMTRVLLSAVAAEPEATAAEHTATRPGTTEPRSGHNRGFSRDPGPAARTLRR